MKNLFVLFFACFSLCMPVNSKKCARTINDYEEVCLSCSIFDKNKTDRGPHRTPPRIPSVYYSRSTNELLFVEPMGECIIELVDTDTEETVFALPILNGVTQVQVPLLSSGQYQLNIICSPYVFSGIIDI